MSENRIPTSKQSHSCVKPEWIRVPEAVRISGLSRSKIYELIASGKIKSFSNRARGCQRGIRLIFHDSLIEYLEQAYLASLENAKAITPPQEPQLAV